MPKQNKTRLPKAGRYERPRELKREEGKCLRRKLSWVCCLRRAEATRCPFPTHPKPGARAEILATSGVEGGAGGSRCKPALRPPKYPAPRASGRMPTSNAAAEDACTTRKCGDRRRKCRLGPRLSVLARVPPRPEEMHTANPLTHLFSRRWSLCRRRPGTCQRGDRERSGGRTVVRELPSPKVQRRGCSVLTQLPEAPGEGPAPLAPRAPASSRWRSPHRGGGPAHLLQKETSAPYLAPRPASDFAAGLSPPPKLNSPP